jgi:hypothetical protein
MSESPAYFVFDVESVADPDLVSKVHFAGRVPPEESVRNYRDELLALYNSDFIPYTFQIPITIAVAKVAEDFSLMNLVVIEPEPRSHEIEPESCSRKIDQLSASICKKFWHCWKEEWKKNTPTLVSFNGRGFDIPLLELAAFRYGIEIPKWFALNTKYDQPRSRYNTKAHFDLHDFLTNHGATRFNGGLNLAASLLGKPGKIDTQGFMVQDMYDAGKLSEINDYCRCDVLDTYFVFLRTMVLAGNLSLAKEQELVKNTKSWIEQQSETIPIYRQYLDNWGDWQNPWE